MSNDNFEMCVLFFRYDSYLYWRDFSHLINFAFPNLDVILFESFSIIEYDDWKIWKLSVRPCVDSDDAIELFEPLIVSVFIEFEGIIYVLNYLFLICFEQKWDVWAEWEKTSFMIVWLMSGLIQYLCWYKRKEWWTSRRFRVCFSYWSLVNMSLLLTTREDLKHEWGVD